MPFKGKRPRKRDAEPWWQKYKDALDDLDSPPTFEIPELPAAEYIPPDEPAWDDASLTQAERERFRAVMAEMAAREREALRLYEPMQDQEAFHASQAPERLVLGGNRGGKTLCVCVEIARAITGQDPHGKYSLKDGRFIVVGKDLLHCSKVIYRKLFKPGAFKVIFDPRINKVRAFRPWEEWDQAHALDARPAPPLVPARFLSPNSVSWENKREEIPKTIKLKHTGWELSFFSSLSAPPQGWDADAAAFDEEIEHPQWYVEVSARLMDRRTPIKGTQRFLNGRFFWSATPQAGTEHLYNLFERAEKAASDPEPAIEKFEMGLIENRHIDQAAKDEFIEKLATNEDEYEVRVKGKFAILGARVYPEFLPKGVHGCPSFPVPEHWTRYMALDPGRQVCAALFVAVPPHNEPDIRFEDGLTVKVAGRKVIYSELYIKKSSAKVFAARLKSHLGDQEVQSWWIDHRAGRITEMGSGLTIEEQYSLELKALRLACRSTGARFLWGSDDVKAGINAVRSGLHVQDGASEWLVLHEAVPNFLEEAKKYAYKKLPGTNIPTDEPLQRNNHLMDCFRYLAMAPLKYVPHRKKAKPTNYTNKILAEKRARKKERDGGSHICLY